MPRSSVFGFERSPFCVNEREIEYKLLQRNRITVLLLNLSVNADIFVGTIEEFQHYYEKPSNEFFELVSRNSTRIVGAVLIMCQRERLVAIGIGLELPTANIGPPIYKILRKDRFPCNRAPINDRCNIVRVNNPCNVAICNLAIGQPYWTICAYSIRRESILNFVLRINPGYEVQRLGDFDSVDDIVRFDYELFHIEDRRDFIEVCAERSDVVFVLRKHNEIKAVGMLSKVSCGKRLLGPMYAKDDESMLLLIDLFLHYILKYGDGREVVAYAPKVCAEDIALDRKGVPRGHSWQKWIRSSKVDNYNLPAEKIGALGSLIFDDW